MTKDLQDKYDIYHFHRDNVVSNAGNKGIYVDLSMLPTHLGDTPEDRLLTFMGSAKQGFATINTAQEGSTAMNTVIQNYDMSLDYNAIQAYNALIDMIERTASYVTGVPPQMLAQIEAREAVSNVQTGIKQGLMVVRPLFYQMDIVTRAALSDLLKLSQISYVDGKKLAYLAGSRSKFFTLDPDHFCFTDYNVHVNDSAETITKMQESRQIVLELVKAQAIQMDVVFDIIKSNSITEISEIAKNQCLKLKRRIINYSKQYNS